MGITIFDVDKIVDYLKPFRENLDSVYSWDTPSDKNLMKAIESGVLNDEQSNFLSLQENTFLRNVELKKILREVLSKTTSVDIKKDIYRWIVKEWGGIDVKNIDKLYTTINKYLDVNKKVNSEFFNSISSNSKILSFLYPEKYIIYDARVAYTLNWIILKTGAAKVFFPMPSGRNSKLTAIDISTLIRLTRTERYIDNFGIKNMIDNSDKNIFVKKTVAYDIMCNLVKEINNRLWEDEKRNYPFFTEMLLFALADKEVFLDVLESCSLSIR
ncbi:hypothetical protein [Clostridium cellulovorans]|uniref:Uncharacterized protein n=1 Tax=Clostridium cellulovorans (strain ATCC 35296 / DSM 3052 / OCM 3 / 743B) TaxID=573061 RepID=D9SRB8_CLOC7|nr:hypothetical protein [Clostridium cellulovorans]ADL52347.1 hypothetical protein Clocel_2644 [Clostridium cellulovorans 743B]